MKSDPFPTPSSFPGKILDNARIPYVTPTTLPSSTSTPHASVSTPTTLRSSPVTTSPAGGAAHADHHGRPAHADHHRRSA